jgi:ribosomal protein S20
MSKKIITKNIVQREEKAQKYLNSSIKELDTKAMYKTFHPETAEIKFFSSTHRDFLKINPIVIR